MLFLFIFFARALQADVSSLAGVAAIDKSVVLVTGRAVAPVSRFLDG